ncbi:hypothetical protein [Halosimplex salinum]|uniref:hypothetical protein n=1 Tax=Halosimplex salinum TaxID=1710538 RepID=UPI000F4A883C|nr:hypothetical protein [Halosimplex salinum]
MSRTETQRTGARSSRGRSVRSTAARGHDDGTVPSRSGHEQSDTMDIHGATETANGGIDR